MVVSSGILRGNVQQRSPHHLMKFLLERRPGITGTCIDVRIRSEVSKQLPKEYFMGGQYYGDENGSDGDGIAVEIL